MAFYQRRLNFILNIDLFGLRAASYKIKQDIEKFFAEKKLPVEKVLIITHADETNCENLGGDSVELIRITTDMANFKKKLGKEFLALPSISQDVRVKLIILDKSSFLDLRA